MFNSVCSYSIFGDVIKVERRRKNLTTSLTREKLQEEKARLIWERDHLIPEELAAIQTLLDGKNLRREANFLT